MAKKNIKKSSIKKLKHAIYRGRTLKFKKTLSTMLIVGIIASGLWLCRYFYIGYAESEANIIISYPEIAFSSLPDNSRFTYYDLISYDNVNTALDIMHEKDLYESYTAEDLRNCFFLYSQLEGSATNTVMESRKEGNDFTFVANNYKLTYIQPHDYKNPNLVKKFFSPDLSCEFLTSLIEANRIRIAEKAGGINAFKDLVVIDNADSYDYNERLKVYRAKIREIKRYLSFINKNKSNFVSEKHNMTLKDIESRYDFLVSSDIDSISNLIESSVLSKDIPLAVNKLNVNIENNTLKYNKCIDRSTVNQYAMSNYDQTFTENLISVVIDDDYGLYQARPKTAFDKVVERKHSADEDVADYGAKLERFREDLWKYSTVQNYGEEYDRLIAKCDELMAALDKKYSELSVTATEVVTEYLNDTNDYYITAKVEKKNIVTKAMLIKLFVVFSLAAVLTLIAIILTSEVHDDREMKKKKQLLHEIKHIS